MSNLQIYVRNMLGTKFGHFNASYKGLEEKYGQPKMDTIPTYHYNSEYREHIISTFYDGKKEVAKAIVEKEYYGDYIPWYEDNYFENAESFDNEKVIQDYTTGLTYVYDGNRANIIEASVDDSNIAIHDQNRNGVLDEEDWIVSGNEGFDITVGDYLEKNIEEPKEKEENTEDSVEPQQVNTEKKGFLQRIIDFFK